MKEGNEVIAKIRLSSAQIVVLEALARERGRFVRPYESHQMKVLDSNLNFVMKFRKPTFNSLLKHKIIILTGYRQWSLNPEIKGWDCLRHHLLINENPKVNWYNSQLES